MARKTKVESQNTRNGILDVAELVFLEKGVAQTAMADIADAAGISRGAVYGHYKNKIDVCLAMCDRAFARAAEGFELVEDGPVLETLRQAALHYLRQCVESGSVQRVLEILYMKCEQSEENAPLLRRRTLYDKQTLRITTALLRALWPAVNCRPHSTCTWRASISSRCWKAFSARWCGPTGCTARAGKTSTRYCSPASIPCTIRLGYASRVRLISIPGSDSARRLQ